LYNKYEHLKIFVAAEGGERGDETQFTITTKIGGKN
jgi:hypothetical protein